MEFPLKKRRRRTSDPGVFVGSPNDSPSLSGVLPAGDSVLPVAVGSAVFSNHVNCKELHVLTNAATPRDGIQSSDVADDTTNGLECEEGQSTSHVSVSISKQANSSGEVRPDAAALMFGRPEIARKSVPTASAERATHRRLTSKINSSTLFSAESFVAKPLALCCNLTCVGAGTPSALIHIDAGEAVPQKEQKGKMAGAMAGTSTSEPAVVYIDCEEDDLFCEQATIPTPDSPSHRVEGEVPQGSVSEQSGEQEAMECEHDAQQGEGEEEYYEEECGNEEYGEEGEGHDDEEQYDDAEEYDDEECDEEKGEEKGVEEEKPESIYDESDDPKDEDFEIDSNCTEDHDNDDDDCKKSRKRTSGGRRSTLACAGSTAKSRNRSERDSGRTKIVDKNSAAKFATMMRQSCHDIYAGELRDLILQPKTCYLSEFLPAVPFPSHQTMVSLLVFAASTMVPSNEDEGDPFISPELYDYIFSYAAKCAISSKKSAMGHLRVWFDAVFGVKGQCYLYLDPIHEHPVVQANQRVPTLLVANQYPGDSWRYAYMVRSRMDIGFTLGHILLVPFFTSSACVHILKAGPPGGISMDPHWIPGITRVLQKGLHMWVSCKRGAETIYNLTRVGLDARAYNNTQSDGILSSVVHGGCKADLQRLQQRHGPLPGLCKNPAAYYNLHPNENVYWEHVFATNDFGTANEEVGNKHLTSLLFEAAAIPRLPSGERLPGFQQVTSTVLFSALDYYANMPGDTGGRCCFVLWGNRTQIKALHDACSVLFRYQTVVENFIGFCPINTNPWISRRFKLTLVDSSIAGGNAWSFDGETASCPSGPGAKGLTRRKRKVKGAANEECDSPCGVAVDCDGGILFGGAPLRGKLHIVFFVAQTVEVDGACVVVEPKLSKVPSMETVFVYRVLDTVSCMDNSIATTLICPRSLANAINSCAVLRWREGAALGLRCISLLYRMTSEINNDCTRGPVATMQWLAVALSPLRRHTRNDVTKSVKPGTSADGHDEDAPSNSAGISKRHKRPSSSVSLSHSSKHSARLVKPASFRSKQYRDVKPRKKKRFPPVCRKESE